MKRRPRRAVAAALTALVVAAVSAVVAVVAIQLILGERPWIDHTSVAGLRWSDLPVAVAGGAFVLLGLVLALAAVLPGRLVVLPIRADSGITRHSYRSTLRRAAADVDGVSRAKLTLRRRRVSAKVRTERTNTTGLADAVRSALEHRLGQLDPSIGPRISVKVVRRAK
ncbi:DUF6286 domain-containing protein [Amycolatopsis sp. YIM 10]|uniref:DUF6286 domain-containing protein n=1 Tax=Amycolatopsis sp. YIM 10 TaxID=2653857 RepID=UPI00128FE4F5|nr:DUF6286 domain-containing protein [Amycolatopsis sp. YIM 10]QFU88251.1 hypothetical protein YIM_15330 [Amycolatopsis sp. YIM 10]